MTEPSTEQAPPTFQDRLIDKLRGRLGDLELELSSTALRLDLVAAERDYCVQVLAQHGLATQDADGNIKIGPPEEGFAAPSPVEVVPPEDVAVLD